MTTLKKRLWHRAYVGVCGAALIGLAAGCEGAPGDIGPPGDPGSDGAAVTVTPSATSVEVGATVTLIASTTPAPQTAETYTWESSRMDIATVGADGTVTGMAVGIVLVTATGDTSGATGLAAISVVPSTVTQPVSFADDVLPLFTTGNYWYVGAAACNAAGCHTGAGSAHDLDMGSYDGVMLGADLGAEPIIVPSDWSASSLRARLRNNRMPWNVSIFVPRDGPAVADVAARFPGFGWTDASSVADANGIVRVIAAWIDGGAPNGDFSYVDSLGATITKNYGTHVQPMFVTGDVWQQGTEACNAAGCHNGAGGAHDLDMGSYAGVMLGADLGAEPIVVPGDSAESPLRKRLRNNRMPWGMPTSIPRDGPNGEVGVIGQWVTEGALDN